jgi:hypothetical protein
MKQPTKEQIAEIEKAQADAADAEAAALVVADEAETQAAIESRLDAEVDVLFTAPVAIDVNQVRYSFDKGLATIKVAILETIKQTRHAKSVDLV